jgi:hypothetical protein
MSKTRQLPLPSHFDPEQVGQIWRVPYQERAKDACLWAIFPLLPRINSKSP